jgi:hypothetical protein
VPLDDPEEARPVPLAPRRRRRAVGPPGAPVSEGGDLAVLSEPDAPAREEVARDEELRRDVPPHHGG